MAVVDSIIGGQHCRRTTSGAAPRVAGASAMWQIRGGSKWTKYLLPLMTVGGPGMVTTFRHRLPHQRRHRSLPQRLVAMPGASQRLCRVPSDLLTLTVRFGSLSPRRLPHIVQKVSVRCGRLCGCDEARAKRTMRVFHVPSSSAVGLGAQRGTFAAMPVCTTPLSSRDKPHSIVIRMARRP